MPPEDNVAEIGQSYHALYHNVQVRRAYGYGVVSGGKVSPGSTGLSVDVDGGTALFDGDRRSIPSRTDLSIPAPDASDPRKDLVVYDGTTVDVIVGTAQPAPSDQASASRFELYQPSPPDTADTAVVVLAELFVPAGASSLSAADVNDLRTDPSVDADRVSLPDDAPLTLGDGDDFTVRYAADAARLIVETPGGNTFEYLNDGSLLIDGDLVAEGDVTFGGTFDPETITPDVVDVGESLELPVYADNDNATQDAAEVWFNDGTGPDAAGIYYFDGGVVGPLETGSGSSPGTLSGLTVDVDQKDFDGATFTGMGHDDVDVPQTFDLTVDDFERASLGDDYVGDTQDAEIQSSVALEGSRSLQISRSSNGNSFVGASPKNPPQLGDTFVYRTQITDGGDVSIMSVLVESPQTRVFDSTGLIIEVRADQDVLRVRNRVASSNTQTESSSGTFSNFLSENLKIEVEMGLAPDITVTAFDPTGAEITSVTTSIDDKIPKSGGVQYEANNGSVAPTIYFDGPFIERRTTEETRDRQRGSREIAKTVSRGGVGAGPRILPENRASAVMADQGVSSEVSAGTEVGYGLQLNGERGLELRAEADGSGGVQNPVVDLSDLNSDLRLATGQSIEDGSGTRRLSLGSTFTGLFNPNGDVVINARTGETKITATGSRPLIVRDREGDFDALTYTASASAPGTLELTNANLRKSDLQIYDRFGEGALKWDSGERLYTNNNDEILVEDGDGNDTFLT